MIMTVQSKHGDTDASGLIELSNRFVSDLEQVLSRCCDLNPVHKFLYKFDLF